MLRGIAAWGARPAGRFVDPLRRSFTSERRPRDDWRVGLFALAIGVERV
jgi:hypothetical protein